MAESSASRSGQVVQSIDRNNIYGIQEFLEITGIGASGLRAARRKGLPVHYVHGRAFVLGSDWLRYLESASTEAPGPKQGTVPDCVQRLLPFDDEEDEEDEEDE